MITASDISRLEDELFTCISEKQTDSESFQREAKQILHSSQRDYIFGGLFDNPENAEKTLSLNAKLASVFILAANYFGDSNYARLASETLGFILLYHQDSTGVFVSKSRFPQTEIDLDNLISVLMPSQWIALKTCFDLPASGYFQWHQIKTIIAQELISQHTDLHPKEVPLALDGALQIVKSVIPGPAQSGEESLLSNMQLCNALYLSAAYLNQAEHGEIANALLDLLLVQDITKHKSTLLSLLLIRLRYQWDADVFNHLKSLYSHYEQSPDKDLNIDLLACTELLIQSLEQHPAQPITHQSKLLSGIVIITGPEFLARQWLQETNNRFQLHYRFFAIAGSADTGSPDMRAQLIRADGTKQDYMSLNELLSLAV